MNQAAGITDYEETIYAPPSTLDVNIMEVKHGIGEQSKTPFTVFVVQVNDVIDQKLPRPDCFDDQSEIEPGDVLTLYSRRDFNSDKKLVADAMAVLVGQKLGRPEIEAKHLKCPLDRKTGDFILDQAKDPEAFETYLASFNVMKGDKVKENREDFFEGTRVILDVEPKKNKDGSPKKFTSYTFSHPEA